MTPQHPDPQEAHRAPAPLDISPEDAARGMETLRRLLAGQGGEERITQIEERLDEAQTRAGEVGAVLPEALRQRADDPGLGRALRTPVEDALQASVRKNPQPLVDAIFPVIGPAIRKAIAHSLRELSQRFETTMQHGLSPKALMWRMQAWRTGRPYAEVVLLKTLVYRIEQVFWIHKDTGLLLHNVAADHVVQKDANLVSVMLTAIQDFVKDSFGAGGEDAVETLEVGEYTIWVAAGRQSILAAVMRGTAPEDLRTRLQETVERCEAQTASVLADFDGDAGPYEACEPELESLLEEVKSGGRRDGDGGWFKYVFFVGLLALVLFAGYRWLDGAARDNRLRRFVSRLDAEPGLVITEHRESDDGYVVRGLRDPLARNPAELRGELRTDDAVTMTWRPYQSPEPGLALKRAELTLRPPPGVNLALADGVLTATGQAGHAWIVDAQRVAPVLPGVDRFVGTDLIDVQRVELERKCVRITRQWDKAPLATSPHYAEMISNLVAEMAALAEQAAAIDRKVQLQVSGPDAKRLMAGIVKSGLPAHRIAMTATTPTHGGTAVRCFDMPRHDRTRRIGR